VVEVDVLNASQSVNSQLTFPSHHHQQHQRADDDDDDETWKQSLGFIRLSSNNLINTAGNVAYKNTPCSVLKKDHFVFDYN